MTDWFHRAWTMAMRRPEPSCCCGVGPLRDMLCRLLCVDCVLIDARYEMRCRTMRSEEGFLTRVSCNNSGRNGDAKAKAYHGRKHQGEAFGGVVAHKDGGVGNVKEKEKL